MSLPKLLPKLSREDQPPAPEPQQTGKRRRGTHHTACNYCRAKREKCSGLRPTCNTCERHGQQCVYEAPQGVTRQQAYKQRLESIERSSSSLRNVVEMLRHGTEADVAAALSRIRQAEDVDEAVSVLTAAQIMVTSTSPSIGMTPRSTSPPDEMQSIGLHGRPIVHFVDSANGDQGQFFENGFPQARDQYNRDDVFIDMQASSLPISRWTSACKDDRLMNHLLNLFWAWDNMVEPLLFRPLLEEDLSSNDGQTPHSFCSPFLVNTLLALSCLFTTESESFSDPDDPSTRGQHFAEEAKRHFEKEKDNPSVPLLQGQFAMFVYEGNLGVGSKAIDSLMRTIDTYEALNNIDFLNPHAYGKSETRLQNEREGLSWIMWGLYCAEWRVSQAFGFQKPTAKPVIPKLWRSDTFSLRQSNNPCYWWCPYPRSLRTQRSMKVEIREVDTHLSEIAEDVLDYLYQLPDGSSEHPTSNPQRAVELYNRLIQWKFSLPARLRLEEAVHPRAILLHSYVEVLLVAVLRPFSHLTRSQFGPFTPKDRCYAHCASLMDSIWTFRAFASLNGEYWYVYMLATVAFVVFQEHRDNPVQTETIIKACKCLHELSPIYPLAIDALGAIRGAFKKKGISVPTYLRPFLESGVIYKKDGLLHHAIAQLFPDEDWPNGVKEEVRFQELLDEIGRQN